VNGQAFRMPSVSLRSPPRVSARRFGNSSVVGKPSVARVTQASWRGGAGASRRELFLDALEVREEAPSGMDELRRTEIAQGSNGLSGCGG
jgi:hypothetical protein